jgi:hypothetical protein
MFLPAIPAINGLSFPHDHDHSGDQSPESVFRRHLAACAEARKLKAIPGDDRILELRRELAYAICEETRKALTDLIDSVPPGAEELPEISYIDDPERDEFSDRVEYIDGKFLAHVWIGDDYLVGFDPAPVLDRLGLRIVAK